MKLSFAAGVNMIGMCVLLSVADASSKYRSAHRSGTQSSTTSRSRRRTRSIPHDEDNDDDYDFHRSLARPNLEGGSSYSSSPSLNENWELEELSSYSSFYDFEDLKPYRKKKKRKTKGIDETERVLRALERRRRKENDGADDQKRSRRKKKLHREGVNGLSSLPSKSSKKKRRRKHKTAKLKSNVSRSAVQNVSQARSFSPKNPTGTSTKTMASSVDVSGSCSSPSQDGQRVRRQTSQPKSHPDRTTWEVPSYSHKISTMMKKKGSTSEAPRVASTTAVPRTRRVTSDPTSKVNAVTTGRSSSTDRTSMGSVSPSTRSTRAIKSTTMHTSSTQSSTLGSTTTPWVRKFLSGRPKDRLLPLPKDYISDNFNLAQLPPIVERIGYQAMGDDAIPVAKALQQQRMAAAASGATQPSKLSSYPIYRRALKNILADPTSGKDEGNHDEDMIIPPYAIQKASEALYLLLHARFVVSPRGLEAIRHVMALDNTVFGKCPRSNCKGTGLLPYGYSNDYKSDASVPTVTTASRKEHDSCCHRYCPSCGEVWISWESKTDGCAWGPSWCHLFLLAFGSQIYAKELEAAAAAATNTSNNEHVLRSPQQSQQVSIPSVRSFLPRGIGTRGSMATINTNTNASNVGSNRGSDDLSRPTPSVFGFRIHPSTPFGRPFNEASLRGGSSD